MRLITFLLLFAVCSVCRAGEPVVRSVWFRSDLAQPVHRLPPDLRGVAERLPQWRAPGLEALGLWTMISAAPARFGLSQEQALAMRDAINTRYLAIGRDPDMAALQSAWPEAISTDPQRRGH